MCRHHEAWVAGLGGSPGQEAKREVGDCINDIAEGLELSKKLLLLADGHWKDCDHPGRLPLQGILQECAHRITDEAQRRRRELEGSGKVHFGSVVLEESTDSEGQDQALAAPWDGPPLPRSYPEDPAARFLSEAPAAAGPRNPKPFPIETLRRLYEGMVARPTSRGPGWFPPRLRQGGK